MKKSSILSKKSKFWHFFNPNFNWVTFKKMGLINWVVFKQKWVRFFESYSKRSSILWIIFLNDVLSLSYFQKKKKISSLSHVKKSSYEREVKFFETFLRKKISVKPYSKFVSKNWIGFFYVTQRIELFSLIWLTEFTLFLYDSQNWTF